MNRLEFIKNSAVGVAAAWSAATVWAPKARANNGNRRLVPSTNGVDDRAMIQELLDEGAGEVVFGAGQTWTIDSTIGSGGLSPRSDTRIVIEDGAVLMVKPNAEAASRLFDIGRDEAVRNVTIEGSGTMLGDVLSHTGSVGEWGHLVHITNGSANIQVLGPLVLRQAWGDGIYIGDGSAINYDVVIDGVTVDDCRREGIAAFWVDGCVIRNCHIVNIGSTLCTAPGSGIDCEPNAGQLVNDLTIEDNVVTNTAGCGIYVSANPGPVTNLSIRANTVVDCGRSTAKLTTYQTNGIHVAAIDQPTLTANEVRGSGYDGTLNGSSGQIYLRDVTKPIVTGGWIYGGMGRGVLVTHCTAPEISELVVEKNQYEGITVDQSDGASLRGNHFVDNVRAENSSIDHVLVQASSGTITQNNVFDGDSGRSWLRIKGPGTDNLVARNSGVGDPPPNVMLADIDSTTATTDGITLIPRTS